MANLLAELQATQAPPVAQAPPVGPVNLLSELKQSQTGGAIDTSATTKALDLISGGAQVAGAAVSGLGEKAIEGLSSLGGLVIGNTLDESIANAKALTEAIPDLKVGEAGERLVQDISKQFQEAPEVIRNILGFAGESISELGPRLAESAFQATEGLPAEARGAIAAGVQVLPEALEAATGLAAGKQVATGVAQAVGDVAEVSGDVARAIPETGLALFKVQSPTKQKIAQLIQQGSTDIETARFKLAAPGKKAPIEPTKLQKFLNIGGPRVKKDPVAIESIKQGFDEGVIAAIKGATPADKAKMLQMVNIMERGKKNARFAVTNRPSDVAGDSLMDRFRIVKTANRAAGKQLDKVAQTLKGKRVDIEAPVQNFSDTLDELGVRLVDDGKGGLKPDFELSQLSPGDRGPLKEVIRQMNIRGVGGSIDAFNVHKMKRIIDNNVTFGKTKTGISGDAERALKSFRTGLDDALDSTFPAYDRVNVGFAETINAIDALQDVAGKKLNLTGPGADKATGTLLRRLMSNAQSRVALLDAVREVEQAANKFGGKFGAEIPGKKLIEGPPRKFTDDLLMQVLFADELDSVFGPVARTSFQGQIKQGVSDIGGIAAEAKISPLTAATKGAASLVDISRGINQEGKFKAIKELLKEQAAK